MRIYIAIIGAFTNHDVLLFKKIYTHCPPFELVVVSPWPPPLLGGVFP